MRRQTDESWIVLAWIGNYSSDWGRGILLKTKKHYLLDKGLKASVELSKRLSIWMEWSWVVTWTLLKTLHKITRLAWKSVLPSTCKLLIKIMLQMQCFMEQLISDSPPSLISRSSTSSVWFPTDSAQFAFQLTANDPSTHMDSNNIPGWIFFIHVRALLSCI